MFKGILWSDHPHFCICSSIDESAKKILAPYESLSSDESYQSRDLEKVHFLPEMFSFFISDFLQLSSSTLLGSGENEVLSKIYVP